LLSNYRSPDINLHMPVTENWTDSLLRCLQLELNPLLFLFLSILFNNAVSSSVQVYIIIIIIIIIIIYNIYIYNMKGRERGLVLRYPDFCLDRTKKNKGNFKKVEVPVDIRAKNTTPPPTTTTTITNQKSYRKNQFPRLCCGCSCCRRL
jgi:hypothetical protein